MVRFELWGSDPGAVDTGMTGLQARVLAARDVLRGAGFLLINSVDTPAAETFPSISAWRKTTTLRVLYEYLYQDSDDADSLIARIPVTIDSQYNETLAITDDMARWDNVEAPALVVTGVSDPNIQVTALSILAYLPAGWDGHTVTVDTSVAGVQHTHSYPSVRALYNTFVPAPGTVDLGGNPYAAATLAFPNPTFPNALSLVTANDSIRISYADNAFDQDAVVYLRVLG